MTLFSKRSEQDTVVLNQWKYISGAAVLASLSFISFHIESRRRDGDAVFLDKAQPVCCSPTRSVIELNSSTSIRSRLSVLCPAGPPILRWDLPTTVPTPPTSEAIPREPSLD